MNAQTKFDPNRPFKCRDGSIAEIAKIYETEHTRSPLLGRWKMGQDGWSGASWNRDGSYAYGCHAHRLDLINEPETFTKWITAWRSEKGTISVLCDDAGRAGQERGLFGVDGMYKLIACKRVDLVEGEGIENPPSANAAPPPTPRGESPQHPQGTIASENWTGRGQTSQSAINPNYAAAAGQTASSLGCAVPREAPADVAGVDGRLIREFLAAVDEAPRKWFAIEVDPNQLRAVSSYLRRAGWRP